MSTVAGQQKRYPGRSADRPPNASRHSAPSDSARAIRRVIEDAQTLGRTAEEATGELRTLLRAQLKDRPYVALALASGVGYLLGGGGPVRLASMLWNLGSRLALEMFVRDVVNGSTSAAAGAAGAPYEDVEAAGDFGTNAGGVYP